MSDSHFIRIHSIRAGAVLVASGSFRHDSHRRRHPGPVDRAPSRTRSAYLGSFRRTAESEQCTARRSIRRCRVSSTCGCRSGCPCFASFGTIGRNFCLALYAGSFTARSALQTLQKARVRFSPLFQRSLAYGASSASRCFDLCDQAERFLAPSSASTMIVRAVF